MGMATHRVEIRPAENRGFILRLEFIETHREWIADTMQEVCQLLYALEWRQPDGSRTEPSSAPRANP